jgi:hypothetical protein
MLAGLRALVYHAHRMRPSRLTLPLLLAAVVVVASCSEDMFDGQNDLVVLNESGCPMRVMVDGREAFSVKPGSDRVLDDIGAGRHVLEAVDASDRVLERRTVELSGGEDFFWTLDHC